MKQPELGHKILELRKSKGLTQEELVERCNISVRTIQRIETGEVNPRSYTIKTILSALESDFKELYTTDPIFSKELSRSLKFAWISGIMYFILGFPEGLMDFTRVIRTSEIPEDIVFNFFPVVDFSPYFYLSIKVFVLLSYLVFMRGFVSIGENTGEYFLSIISRISIGLMIFIVLYDIFSIFYSEWDTVFIQIGIAMALGLTSIIFGIALIKLREKLSIICKIAGLLEMVAGILFLFLIPIALVIHMLAILLEIIIIYQMAQKFLFNNAGIKPI